MFTLIKQYKKARNAVTMRKRKDEIESVIEIISVIRRLNCPSAYWRTVKNLDSPNQNKKSQLNENGTLVVNEKQLANIMMQIL